MDQINDNATWFPFKEEITHLINRHNIDGLTNTPDYILAEMICGYIIVHANATRMRDDWFGVDLEIAFHPEIEELKEVTIDE